jgi:hypothetical protein
MLHKHSPWILAVLALLFIGVLTAGFYFWGPGRGSANSTVNSDLGLTLIGGTFAGLAGGIVALAIFRFERDVAAAQERAQLRLILGIERDLTGIDLCGQELSNIYLRRKKAGGCELLRL